MTKDNKPDMRFNEAKEFVAQQNSSSSNNTST